MPDAAIDVRVHSQASINVRAIVLPRAKWKTEFAPDGRQALRPEKATWFGHIVRGRGAHEVTIVPMVGCPACGGLLLLSHSEEAAAALRAMTGMPVPVSHSIDHLGKVTPDVLCKHGRCDFHRRVYLERWKSTKPLYAVAYVEGVHGDILIDYCNAIDRREALFHWGAGTGARRHCRIIDAAPAVGFFVDEKTGRMTAD